MREIFVFDSNTEGRHGKGAALDAMKYHAAEYGRAFGLQGNSYAIITKDLSKGTRSIPLILIHAQVNGLKNLMDAMYMSTGMSVIFNVTPIGCGLAGYTPEEIAPMFHGVPPNVKLPEVFLNVLNKQL